MSRYLKESSKIKWLICNSLKNIFISRINRYIKRKFRFGSKVFTLILFNKLEKNEG